MSFIYNTADNDTCWMTLKNYYYRYIKHQSDMQLQLTQHKKASNHHANLPLEMYSFTL